MQSASYSAQMQAIVREYRLAGRAWPASSRTIAAWAITTKRWELTESAAVGKCAEDLSRAMREEMMTDLRGRRVRTKHPVMIRNEGEQTAFWDDIRTAPRRHMEMSFAQRRNQIVGDCRQLHVDVDSYNDAHSREDPIQIVLDFTNDVAELEASRVA